jgi:hypothetical protein
MTFGTRMKAPSNENLNIFNFQFDDENHGIP